jgi:hypothetical protein
MKSSGSENFYDNFDNSLKSIKEENFENLIKFPLKFILDSTSFNYQATSFVIANFPYSYHKRAFVMAASILLSCTLLIHFESTITSSQSLNSSLIFRFDSWLVLKSKRSNFVVA